MSLPRLPSPLLDRGGDRVHFSQALLGRQGRGVEPGQRRGGLLHQVGHLDRLFGSDHVELGDLRRVGLSGGQLDQLGADQALGDDPRHGVGANQPSQPFIDPQNELDGTSRLVRRDDLFHDARVDSLNPDAMAGFEPADRLEPGSHVKRRLHPPLAAGDLVEPEAS